MPSLKAKSVDPQAPLTPARAILVRTIERLWDCQRRFDKAREPLSEMERIRASSVSTEALELRSLIDRRHTAHAAEIAAWVAAGAAGDRPEIGAELFEAERRLGQIGAEAQAAAVTIAIVEEGAAGAAENVRQAMHARDAAVWPATVEACRPVLAEMERILSAAAQLEARVQGLVHVLRNAGDRDSTGNIGAYQAAEAIERRLGELRRTPRAQPDTAPGHELIKRLRTDATAAF
jgi:hypothetical protein